MRTTLDIDEDVLQAAKELGAKERRIAGAVLSDMARLGFRGRGHPASDGLRNGVEVLPSRGEVVTMAHAEALMDEEGI